MYIFHINIFSSYECVYYSEIQFVMFSINRNVFICITAASIVQFLHITRINFTIVDYINTRRNCIESKRYGFLGAPRAHECTQMRPPISL